MGPGNGELCKLTAARDFGFDRTQEAMSFTIPKPRRGATKPSSRIALPPILFGDRNIRTIPIVRPELRTGSGADDENQHTR